MKVWGLIALALAISGAALAAGQTTDLRFGASAPGGTLPTGWKPYSTTPGKPSAPVTLVRDGDASVLHIDANQRSGAIAHTLDLPGSTQLSWRWKVDHSVAKANLAEKSGDDYAARVYVFFDLPASELSFGERLKLGLAKHFSDQPLPRAALCYVWDNTHSIGTIAPNAYYGAVKMVVLQSGNAKAGQWQTEQRDLARDFRAAFGKAAPRITGIALASDTDNTKGHAQAWFGDLVFKPGEDASSASPPPTPSPK